MRLPRLYPIIDRATLNARGIAVKDFARELAAAGVGIVQYRDKVGAPQEVLRAAAEIEAAFAGRECLFVMNDRADLAALAGWGVHVGQGDLSVEDARRVVGPDSFVGISTHTLEQVLAAERGFGGSDMGGCGRAVRDAHLSDDEAVAKMGHPDYIAIGPVFATVTKADAEPVVGLEGVRRARALTSKPLVAIGGIARENARSVIEAGADSVAVIGGLFVEGMSVRESAEDFLERLR